MSSKCCLIIGGRRGIGRAYLEFAIRLQYYDRVITVSKNIIQTLAKNHISITGDITNFEIIEAMLMAAEGYSDCSVLHAAGGGLGVDFNSLNEKDFLNVYKLNFIVPTLINSRLLNKTPKLSSLKILHLSSASVSTHDAQLIYLSSKAALEYYVYWIHQNVIRAREKIFINCLRLPPVLVENKGWELLSINDPTLYKKRVSELKHNRLLMPHELNPQIHLLLSDQNSFQSGKIIDCS